MKELTQHEFEQEIQRLINGKIARNKLAKELGTDIRTLNRKIIELSSTNPELYAKYIVKFPYKPKEIQLDIEALAVTIIRNGLQHTMEKTGLNKMTISRKIRKLKTLNPELYKLYTERNERMSFRERENFIQELEKYDRDSELIMPDDVAIRKEELENELNKFQSLINSGLSKDDAARKMGYKDYTPIWEKYRKLERIETEQKASQSLQERVRYKVQPLKDLGNTERNNIPKEMDEK